MTAMKERISNVIAWVGFSVASLAIEKRRETFPFK